MLKQLHSIGRRRGQPPGTPTYSGTQTVEPIRLELFKYNKQSCEELKPQAFDGALLNEQDDQIRWLNINGLYDTDLISTIGSLLGLHALTVEDILHTHQRPRVEELDTAVFVVLRMLFLNKEKSEVLSEQISFVLADNILISFQESPGDVFDGVRNRLRKAKGRIRSKGADYLLYSLLDAVIDSDFGLLEHMGEQIELIEEELIDDPHPSQLNRIYTLKKELLFIRKSVWPLRETVNQLTRGENEQFKESTHIFLKDLYDHTIQVIDTLETFRDMLSGVQDLYLSSMGNKTNQVMKVLTIIATIFIPITFIAGIYGMNFESMPELGWKYGYPAVWALMLLTILGMLYFFKKLKWF